MRLPISVRMLTLNEGVHLAELLPSLREKVEEVVIVDSFSSDDTVDVALSHGATVVQRRFTSFGDQWNFALTLPTVQPWTMKLDPDERISEELYDELKQVVPTEGGPAGYTVPLRLWFMGKPLHVKMRKLRLWRSGSCRFSDVLVNEHADVPGEKGRLRGHLEHLDSTDLHHWADKQNYYSSMEAITAFEGRQLAAEPRFWGSTLQRRMWFKKHFLRIPFRYQLLWLGLLFFSGAWRDGKCGRAWTQMRIYTRRMREFKLLEMQNSGKRIELPPRRVGKPDPRVTQAVSGASPSEE